MDLPLVRRNETLKNLAIRIAYRWSHDLKPATATIISMRRKGGGCICVELEEYGYFNMSRLEDIKVVSIDK